MKKCDTVYLITLAGARDDLPVAVFDTRAGVDAFVIANRPCPVAGQDAIQDGPLAHAYNVAGCGPSIVLGYKVWEIKDGVPVHTFIRRWTNYEWWPNVRVWEALSEDNREAFDRDTASDPWEPQPEYPAARTGRWKNTTGPQEEWAVPHEGDHTGGGPVG